MHRILLLPLLLCVACSPGDEPAKTPGGKRSNATAEPAKKPAPASPATGIAVIQRDHNMWAKLYEEQAGKKIADQKILKQIITGLDRLVLALELSIREQARDDVEMSHGRARGKLAKMKSDEQFALRELAEIRAILSDAAKGAAPIPSGFTEAELRDRLADQEEKLRVLKNEREELIKKTRKQESLLKKETVSPQEETMATRELAAVKVLKKKAEDLLSKVAKD
jgi:hypothetical protein